SSFELLSTFSRLWKQDQETTDGSSIDISSSEELSTGVSLPSEGGLSKTDIASSVIGKKHIYG
ncbi:hypothetical protein NPIL_123451, partial [Nephila pilipes]